MMIIRNTIFFLFLSFIQINAQFSIIKNQKDKEYFLTIMDKIYNFEFADAEKLISEVQTKYPGHPVYPMLKAVKLYWEIIPIDHHPSKFEQYSNYLNEVIKLGEPMLDNERTKLEATFFLMSAYCSRTLINVKSKDYTRAISEARKAYQNMKTGFVLGEKIPDFHLSTGLYNYYVDIYPKVHPLLAPLMWFFPKGDRKKGISELEKGSIDGIFGRTESIYFLAHVNLKYENKPEVGLFYAKKLIEKYPKNTFFLLRATEAFIAAEKYEEAKPYLNELKQSPLPYFQMISALFEGNIEENANKDLKAALNFYQKAIGICQKHSFYSNDYYGLINFGHARIYEKEKNFKKADEFYDKTEETVEYLYAIEAVKKYKNTRRSN